MIVETTITIGCDHEACTARFTAELGASTDGVAYARRAARFAGWTHRLMPFRGFSRSVDYCRAHALQHHHETVEAR